MDRPTCRTCPFYHRVQFGDPLQYSNFECRRFPPTAVVLVPTADRPYFVTDAQWPEVVLPKADHFEGDDEPPPSEDEIFEAYWCGEHPDFPAYLAAIAAEKARAGAEAD